MDYMSWAAYLLMSFFVGFFVRKVIKNFARIVSGNYHDG